MKNLSLKKPLLLFMFGSLLMVVGLSIAPLAVADSSCECSYTNEGSGPCDSGITWRDDTRDSAPANALAQCKQKYSDVTWTLKGTSEVTPSQINSTDDKCHAAYRTTYVNEACESKISKQKAYEEETGRGRYRKNRDRRIFPRMVEMNGATPADADNNSDSSSPASAKPSSTSSSSSGGSSAPTGGSHPGDGGVRPGQY